MRAARCARGQRATATGFVYAFGDFLELKSMSGLSGPTYQVLSQAKLIVTPTLLYLIKVGGVAGLGLPL